MGLGCPGRKKGVELALSKGKPGFGSFFFSLQISRIESRTSLEPVVSMPHL